MNLICSILCIGILTIPMISVGQEVNREGWPVQDLKGLIPYSIQVEKVDGVEKIIERFYTPDGGHVARISGNGKTFAYAADHDREPPIDYLLLDPDGFGKFTQKFGSEDSYKIPEWVSRYSRRKHKLTPLIFLYSLNKKGQFISFSRIPNLN